LIWTRRNSLTSLEYVSGAVKSAVLAAMAHLWSSRPWGVPFFLGFGGGVLQPHSSIQSPLSYSL
jgi:hypothetical protein